MIHATGLFGRPSNDELNCATEIEIICNKCNMDDSKASIKHDGQSHHHYSRPFKSTSPRRLVSDASVDSTKSSHNSFNVHSTSSLQKSGLGYLVDKIRNRLTKDSNDSNLRRYWMPDNNSKECYDCGKCTSHLISKICS